MRRDEKLRHNVPLLGKLGIVERLLRALEIGAAVLPIGVEEQRVKSVVEIVVVRGVAPRSPARIELFNAALQIADEPVQPCPPGRALAALTQQDGKDVGDRARFDDNAAIHIRFAEFQCGIEEDAPLRRSRGEPDCCGCPGAVPKDESRSPRSGHPEVSGADQPCEYQSQHPIHRPPPAASIAFARFGRKLCPPERRRWIASSYAWLDSGHRVTRLGAETIVRAQGSVAIAVALVGSA